MSIKSLRQRKSIHVPSYPMQNNKVKEFLLNKDIFIVIFIAERSFVFWKNRAYDTTFVNAVDTS